jgi:hypothetical protein
MNSNFRLIHHTLARVVSSPPDSDKVTLFVANVSDDVKDVDGVERY